MLSIPNVKIGLFLACVTQIMRDQRQNIIYLQTHPIELLEQATIDEYDILYR